MELLLSGFRHSISLNPSDNSLSLSLSISSNVRGDGLPGGLERERGLGEPIECSGEEPKRQHRAQYAPGLYVGDTGGTRMEG